MQTHHPEFERDQREEESDKSFSLSHAVGALHRYRHAIFLSICAIVFFEILGSVAVYLLGPSSRLARVPFRIEFSGAERGFYPNGLRFSSTEVVATSVLAKVYQANQLERFATFDEFKNSVFVSESNRTLDNLALEYLAKLSDPRLTPIDRERLEKEYALKRDSLAHSDYSINMQRSDRAIGAIPQVLVEKALKDVVATWGDQVYHEKGVLEYRLPVVTKSILDPSTLVSSDPIAQIDILRTKINKVITNIDQLLAVPGAEVLRTKGPERISLFEIRINLDDTLRFRVNPLFGFVARHGLLTNMEDSLNYLKAQHEYTERRVANQQGHVRALQDAFSAYIQSTSSAGSAERPTVTGSATAGGAQTVLFGESFIDQIVRMASTAQDIKYRQTASREIAEVMTYSVLPDQAESTYYKQLIEEFKGFRSAAPANRTASEQSFHAAYAAALEDVRRSVGQSDEIYHLLSQNLNPGNLVYNLTGPVEYRVVRLVSGPKLALYSVLLLLLVIPVVLAACLFHNRIREEKRLDLRLHETVRETATEVSSR